jgi:hypothetical protein
MAEKQNETQTPEAEVTETQAPVATQDRSLLSEDADMAFTFMLKAVAEADRLSVGSESEEATLARIFETAEDSATKAEILASVTEARSTVLDPETVKAGLAKARKRYDAGLIAWESEDTPEGFVVPTFPKVKGQSGSGNATGRGAGVPRPRGLRVATKEYGADTLTAEKGYLTCATLAQKLGDGITTAILFDAWKSQAGEDSESWSEGQTASAKIKGKSGKEYEVKFAFKA